MLPSYFYQILIRNFFEQIVTQNNLHDHDYTMKSRRALKLKLNVYFTNCLKNGAPSFLCKKKPEKQLFISKLDNVFEINIIYVDFNHGFKFI